MYDIKEWQLLCRTEEWQDEELPECPIRQCQMHYRPPRAEFGYCASCASFLSEREVDRERKRIRSMRDWQRKMLPRCPTRSCRMHFRPPLKIHVRCPACVNPGSPWGICAPCNNWRRPLPPPTFPRLELLCISMVEENMVFPPSWPCELEGCALRREWWDEMMIDDSHKGGQLFDYSMAVSDVARRLGPDMRGMEARAHHVAMMAIAYGYGRNFWNKPRVGRAAALLRLHLVGCDACIWCKREFPNEPNSVWNNVVTGMEIALTSGPRPDSIVRRVVRDEALRGVGTWDGPDGVELHNLLTAFFEFRDKGKTILGRSSRTSNALVRDDNEQCSGNGAVPPSCGKRARTNIHDEFCDGRTDGLSVGLFYVGRNPYDDSIQDPWLVLRTTHAGHECSKIVFTRFDSNHGMIFR